MDEGPLYQQIAEAVRQQILRGDLQDGDRLPTVREMAEVWRCTPGTVQRAYAELADQGLIESRPGWGTHVLGLPPEEDGSALRRATLLHRVDGFLLETMGAGYHLREVEEALLLGLDRWRALGETASTPREGLLRFAGSHDPAMALLAERFSTSRGVTLQLRFVGSLGGLMRLSRGEAELAGCHLWDARRDTYNVPFVRRLLPGRRVALVTLAHRRLGLILPRGNPKGLTSLADLAQPGVRFVNRQRGAGTRVWLEAQLHRLGIHVKDLVRHEEEALTHSGVARVVAEGEADVGVGVEAAALPFGLDFVPLTQERYELVIPNFVWERESVQGLVTWLRCEEAQSAIHELPGYDTRETGSLRWVE